MHITPLSAYIPHIAVSHLIYIYHAFPRINNYVETLCADDGSPTSVLSAPIPLAQSPYYRTCIQSLMRSTDEAWVTNLTPPQSI